MAKPANPVVQLVDEDDVVRDSLKILLESHGFTVRDFRTTEAFLGADPPIEPACVVLGAHRVIRAGLDLLSRLARRGRVLPVIFVVGGGDEPQRQLALASGAFAYLERPAAEAALIPLVRAAMQQGDPTPAVRHRPRAGG